MDIAEVMDSVRPSVAAQVWVPADGGDDPGFGRLHSCKNEDTSDATTLASPRIVSKPGLSLTDLGVAAGDSGSVEFPFFLNSSNMLWLSLTQSISASSQFFFHKFGVIVRARDDYLANRAIKLLMDCEYLYCVDNANQSVPVRLGAVLAKRLEGLPPVSTVDVCADEWDSCLDRYYLNMDLIKFGEEGCVSVSENLQRSRMNDGGGLPVTKRVPCVLNHLWLFTGLVTPRFISFPVILNGDPRVNVELAAMCRSGDVRLSLKPYVIRRLYFDRDFSPSALCLAPYVSSETIRASRALDIFSKSTSFRLSMSSSSSVPLVMLVVNIRPAVSVVGAPLSDTPKVLVQQLKLDVRPVVAPPLTLIRARSQLLQLHNGSTTTVVMTVSEAGMDSAAKCLEDNLLRRVSINLGQTQCATLKLKLSCIEAGQYLFDIAFVQANRKGPLGDFGFRVAASDRLPSFR